MTLEEHKNYLVYLESIPDKNFGLAFPIKSGTFYFGDVSIKEYISLYKKEIKGMK